jgi:glucan biosynthesis protein C
MQAAETDRLHALDAVRGLALVLGVFFHATLSYMPGLQIWMVKDASESVVLSGTFFVLHIFRMSLFFIIAGFFARMMLQRRGVGDFVRDRLKRIALPLVGFWPIAMGGIIAGSIFAWVSVNPGVAPPPPPQMPSAGGIAFPLTHLWFLYVLLWLYAGALLIRAPFARLLNPDSRFFAALDAVTGFLVKNPLGLIVLATPFVISVVLAPLWMMWMGIPTPDQNLVVNAQALAAYATAFGFGWLLQRRMDLLRVLSRRWAWYLAGAVGLTVVNLYIAGAAPSLAPAPQGPIVILHAGVYALATWAWCFALIGTAMRFLSDHSPVRRYLADASYWIYLVHLPLVIFLQAFMNLVAWPWWIEYPLILAVAFPIMLGTYELLVRYSWIGAILNGRRFPRRARQTAQPALGEA